MGHFPQAGGKKKEMKESIEEIKDILNAYVPEKRKYEGPSLPPQMMWDGQKWVAAGKHVHIANRDISMTHRLVPNVGETQRVMSQIKEAPEEYKFKKPKRCTDNGGCPEGEVCMNGVCVPMSYNELHGDGTKKDFIKKQNERMNFFDVIKGLVTTYYALKNLKEVVSPRQPKVKWVTWKEGGETFSLLEEYIP